MQSPTRLSSGPAQKATQATVFNNTTRPKMSNQSVCVIRLTLFKDSHQSFVAVLDEAQIQHERAQILSAQPQAAGIIETISALSDAMPWNSLAKIIVAWIDARKSRMVIIHTKEGTTIHAKGYSANDVERFLRISENVAVIDTKPTHEI